MGLRHSPRHRDVLGGAQVKVIEINQVVATHMHEWKKWPDTDDKDYDSVFAIRDTWTFRRGDIELRLNNRYYPVYSAYPRSGDLRLPIQFPVINNLCPPSEQVLEQQRRDLRLFGECPAIMWDHAHQCFPTVACDLPELFRLRTLSFADDCPGSSDVKTFPVAANFNALRYVMFTWDFANGARTEDEYRKRGIEFLSFSPSDMTGGLQCGLDELGFTIEGKKDLVRRGAAKPDIAFVGFFGDGERARLMRGLAGIHARQKQLGLDLRLYGVNMPDGLLEPRWPPHVKGLGYPAAPILASALTGPNVPVSSLFNARLADLWMSGVVQIVRDPWGELPHMGFIDGEDYLSFDGTHDDYMAKFEMMRGDRERAVAMISRGYEKAKAFWAKRNWTEAFADIYFHYLGVLTQ